MKLMTINTGDEKIVALLQGNDRQLEEGIRSLYTQYFGFLKSYILANSGSEQDAEDIFQEVIIAFVNSVRSGKFRGESTIRTFLYALNRNLWLNHIKKKERTAAREENYGKITAREEQEIEKAIECRQSNAELMRVLGELGEACKKLLLLFYFENRSMKEIAGSLQYENEQVARNKKVKCLKKMEQLVLGNKDVYQSLKNYLHES